MITIFSYTKSERGSRNGFYKSLEIITKLPTFRKLLLLLSDSRMFVKKPDTSRPRLSSFLNIWKFFFQILEMGIVDFYSGYGSYHHNVVNKWIHIIGVPLILYTFNGMGEWAKIDIGGNSGN